MQNTRVINNHLKKSFFFSSCKSLCKVCLLPTLPGETENNTLVYLWIAASFISSCYTYTWDVKMDWGLFDSKSGEHKFLREETVYNTIVSFLSTFTGTHRTFYR